MQWRSYMNKDHKDSFFHQIPQILDCSEIIKFVPKSFPTKFLEFPDFQYKIADIKENCVGGVANLLTKFGFTKLVYTDIWPGDTQVHVEIESETDLYTIYVKIVAKPKSGKTNEQKTE